MTPSLGLKGAKMDPEGHGDGFMKFPFSDNAQFLKIFVSYLHVLDVFPIQH